MFYKILEKDEHYRDSKKLHEYGNCKCLIAHITIYKHNHMFLQATKVTSYKIVHYLISQIGNFQEHQNWSYWTEIVLIRLLLQWDSAGCNWFSTRLQNLRICKDQNRRHHYSSMYYDKEVHIKIVLLHTNTSKLTPMSPTELNLDQGT